MIKRTFQASSPNKRRPGDTRGCVSYANSRTRSLSAIRLGSLGLLLGVANSARVKDTQHRVDYFLKSFLQKVVPTNVLNLLDWRTCTPQDACLCADSANGQPCPHVQDAVAGLIAVAPPQAQVLALLAALHLFAGICGACAAMFK